MGDNPGYGAPAIEGPLCRRSPRRVARNIEPRGDRLGALSKLDMLGVRTWNQKYR
jgi:hypothetical protein